MMMNGAAIAIGVLLMISGMLFIAQSRNAVRLFGAWVGLGSAVWDILVWSGALCIWIFGLWLVWQAPEHAAIRVVEVAVANGVGWLLATRLQGQEV
jgi:hypothetical protein